MSAVSNATVQQVDTKQVKTKFGMKDTFSFKADGQWYKTGFKRPSISVGDVISFEYVEGKYGKDVNVDEIVAGSGGAKAAPAPAARPAAPYSGGGKGVFPIPALDGQRSIVRQNALTNARELVSIFSNLVTDPSKSEYVSEEKMVDTVIRIAKQFEAYTAGDMDLEAAKAAIES